MRGTPAYTPYHPRWYRKRVSTYWWLGQWSYLKFILRELSSLSVGMFVAITLAELWALRRGPEAHAALQRTLQSPLLIGLNAVAFGFVLWHAVTWFNLAPRALVVRLGARRVPDALIAGANYLAWLVLSGVVAWFVLRGCLRG
jgi:fumarate reductase subunit C